MYSTQSISDISFLNKLISLLEALLVYEYFNLGSCLEIILRFSKSKLLKAFTT